MKDECKLLLIPKKAIESKSVKKGVESEFIYYKSQHLYTYKNAEFGEAFSLL
jgi:hypothetical protein